MNRTINYGKELRNIKILLRFYMALTESTIREQVRIEKRLRKVERNAHN